MPFNWSPKDPDEEYEYTHDWAARLLVDGVDVGDTLVTVGADKPIMAVTEGDVEVTSIVPVPATSKVQYWLRGGTTAAKSKLTGTVKTTQGRTYQESFVLPIKER
ncbi:MAG: hypothetical protein WKF79_00315 [Nocardioides sp.]